MPRSLKFVFFGTPSVARDTLALLVEYGFIPTFVVTSSDAPRGRGLVLTPSPTKMFAIEHNIPFLTPKHLDADALEAISAYECDYALVVAYGKIFPETLIAMFPKGIVNVHYSLLPKYRGATPLETALLSGEQETGVTLQKMVQELDAGDIIAQESTIIASDETARELRPRLITMGAQLLVATLPKYLSGGIVPIVQDASQATRTYKIKKEDGLLDLSASAQENWNTYRAYTDSIGTYFLKDGKRMKITRAECVGGIFRVLRVIPEGKREMEYRFV
jgi:methionyl-tRNA formyltransferase